MICQFCGRKIGWPRRIFDTEFCSAAHKKVARASSSRSLRDARYYYGEEDVASPDSLPAKPRGSFAVSGIVVFVLFAALAVVWAPRGGGGVAREPVSYVLNTDGIWSKLRQVLPSSRPLRNYQESFRQGLGNWTPESGREHSWSLTGSSVRPGRLRLWKPSLPMADYRLDFQAQIEQKAVGWAFRASDQQNYYGAKLVLRKPHPFPVSSIVRYVVVNGHRGTLTELPLPAVLEQSTLYSVRVDVEADTFITFVNGQVVDRWRDDRFRRGGVGFFTDPSEVASVLSVRLSEQGNWYSRFFAAWFLHAPGMPPVAVSPY